MANSIEWQPPGLRGLESGEVFVNPPVPALTPETFDPAVMTEELERLQAGAIEAERSLQAEALNAMYHLKADSIPGVIQT